MNFIYILLLGLVSQNSAHAKNLPLIYLSNDETLLENTAYVYRDAEKNRFSLSEIKDGELQIKATLTSEYDDFSFVINDILGVDKLTDDDAETTSESSVITKKVSVEKLPNGVYFIQLKLCNTVDLVKRIVILNNL